jgi:hypothetical protein
MQQQQGIGYADIAEVRTLTGATACNQLLAEGWVLLGVYPLTTVAEMGAGQPGRDSSKSASRTPSTMSGGWWGMLSGRNENRNSWQHTRCLSLIHGMLITYTACGQ